MSQVDFNTEIWPIFKAKCVECHGPEKVKGKFRLDTRAMILRGGEDASVIPGNSADSYLIELVEEGEMPPKGPPLPAAQIGKLKAWIDQGAKWGAPRKVEPRPDPPTPRPADPSSPETTPVHPELKETGPLVRDLPPAAGVIVDFNRDVQPILEAKCLQCHGPERPKGRFRLDNRELALKGGSEGVAIIPGNSAESPLIHFVARMVPDMEMPPEGDGDPVTDAEIAILRAWIDQDVPWGETSVPEFAMTISPTLRFFSVDGNEQLFREHNDMREDFSGGIQFTLEQWLDAETKLTGEGQFDAPGDYEFTLEVQRQDLGFVRGGVEHFRRYYNNYGGHYAPFAGTGPASFMLDRELHLDVGRFWAEVGIDHPDLPEITLGYEFRFRDGEKSSSLWGQSAQGIEVRNIYPTYKTIQEHVHLLRADVRYTWDGIEFENNFLAEFSDRETTRFEVSPDSFAPQPDVFTSIAESRDTFALTNTFSLQKEIKDWWLLSGGYYYSYLDSEATFDQSTFDPTGTVLTGQHWMGRPIVLDWHAHMFNVNTRLGPYEGVTFTAGVQSNWEQQDALGTSTLFFGLPDPTVPIPPFFISTVGSNKQTVTTREHATLRYDGIDDLVLFLEGELEQTNIDYFEEDPGTFQGFLRDTEERSRNQDYRVGFTWSPIMRATLTSAYGYRLKESRYTHHREHAGGLPNPGYPAFLLGRDTETHEVKTRLSLRPAPWVQARLTHQLRATDYTSDTESVTQGIPTDTAGGSLLAGNYDANIFGAGLVLTPWQDLTLHQQITYHLSNTRSASNGDPGVDSYEGDVISLALGANYRLSENTELLAHYSFTRGDFGQSNVADGLPLGIEYEYHTFQAGIGTRISESLRAQLHYQFQQYDEGSSGGVNDYSAHGIFLNCTFDWN